MTEWTKRDGAPSPLVRCAGAVVRDGAGRLLLVRRAHDPGAGLWSVPGGRVEPGETVEAAAAREVLEETGLVVEVGRLLGVVIRGEYVIHDHEARAVAGRLRAGDDADDVRWVSRAELRDLPLVPLLLESLRDFGIDV